MSSIVAAIKNNRQSFLYIVIGAGASVAVGRTMRLFATEKKNAEIGDRKKSQLYTKTGDKGTSSLYNGERRLKTDIIFEVLGHQDELNCIVGIAREYCLLSNNGLSEMLSEIQSRLFDLGAAVATPVQTSSVRKKVYTEFSGLHTAKLEEWIDHLDATVPPIANFVIPVSVGCTVGALCSGTAAAL